MALQTDEDIKNEQDTLRNYLKRREALENEIQILKDDLKQLNEEFKEKLDIKTLNQAFAVAKTMGKVAHKFTFDNFLSILENEGWADKK